MEKEMVRAHGATFMDVKLVTLEGQLVFQSSD